MGMIYTCWLLYEFRSPVAPQRELSGFHSERRVGEGEQDGGRGSLDGTLGP